MVVNEKATNKHHHAQKGLTNEEALVTLEHIHVLKATGRIVTIISQ